MYADLADVSVTFAWKSCEQRRMWKSCAGQPEHSVVTADNGDDYCSRGQDINGEPEVRKITAKAFITWHSC